MFFKFAGDVGHDVAAYEIEGYFERILSNLQELRRFVDIIVRPLWTMLQTSVRELLRMERMLAVYRCYGSEASMTDAVESPVSVLSMREAFRLIYHESLFPREWNPKYLKRRFLGENWRRFIPHIVD